MALRRPALRPVAATVPGGARGPRRRTVSRRRPSSPCRSTATWPRRSSSPVPTSSPRLGSRRTATGWPGWSGTTRTCPGTRPGCGSRRSAEDGTLGPSDLAAGGPDESVVQPEWSPDGMLHLVSDRSGWWNLYRLVEGPRLEPLAPMEAEFADPPWLFDRSSYAFLPDGSIVAAARRDGHDHLIHIEPGRFVGEVDTAFTEFGDLRVGGDDGRGRWPARRPSPMMLVAFDPVTLEPTGVLLPTDADDHRRRPGSPAPSRSRSRRPAVATAHALFYPPTNPDVTRRPTSAPPLVVLSHGGPTANASTALDLDIQLLTSRGIAVVDVDYGGSTGYGRAYRQQLDGGVGRRRRRRLRRGRAVPGRARRCRSRPPGHRRAAAPAATRPSRRSPSATRSPPGISLFGIGDLETLARDTHKFESRYTDRLVGPYPAMAERYRQRSPVHYLDEISCPVLVLQGLEDKVVPPSQAEARRRGPRRRTGSRTPIARSRARATASAARPPMRATLEARARLPRRGLRVRAGRRVAPTGPARHRGLARAPRPAGRRRADPSAGLGSSGPTDPSTCEPPADRAGLPPARRGRRPVLPRPAAADRRRRSCWCSAALVLGSRPWTCPARSSCEPDLVFLLFLPPILFAAAYFTPDPRLPGESPARSCCWPIGLVLFTTVVVGFVAQRASSRACPGRRPDPRRHRRPAGCRGGDRHLPAPGRARAGSSRSSRARASSTTPSALIAYRVTVWPRARAGQLLRSSTRPVEFVVVGVGGIAVGVVVGALVTRALFRTAEPDPRDRRLAHRPDRAPTSPPRQLGVSGVLATVVAGLITGRKAARVFSPDARLLGLGAWSDRHLGHQRLRVHAHRAAAAVDHGGPVRRARRATCCVYGCHRQPDRHRHALRVGLPGDLPAAAEREASASSDPAPPPGPSSSSRGPACAASSRWRPRWPWRRTSRSAPSSCT